MDLRYRRTDVDENGCYDDDKRTNEQTDKRKNERTNKRTYKRTNERTKERTVAHTCEEFLFVFLQKIKRISR
jgi:hypothetical protein